MASKSSSGGNNTTPRYRDSKTGEFLTDRKGSSMPPERVQRESVPKPGRGDTGRGKK